MTYPTSPNDAFDAGGAFVIGGGDFNFGQDYTESLIKTFFKVPAPTIGGAIEALRQSLLRLPLEALQVFRDLIPDSVEFVWDTVTGAVDAIISSLLDSPLFVPFSAFNDFLNTLLTNPGEVLGMIEQSLVNGLTSALGLLNSAWNQLEDIINGVIITPINSAVAAFRDWFNDIVTQAQDTADKLQDGWNKFWEGIFGLVAGGNKDADEVKAAAIEISTRASNAMLSSETLGSTILLPRTQPIWVSKWPQDDVAFPVANIDGTTSVVLDRLYLIPVTATQDRVYESLKFGLAANTMTNIYVGVYKVNTSTGNADLVLDLGDCKSLVSSAYNQQSLALPSTLAVSKGENHYIGILQRGGTAAPMHSWSNTTTFTDSPVIHPPYIGNYLSGTTTSLPSSFLGSNVVPAPRLWGAMGYGTSVITSTPVYYSDNFNRANDSTGLGASWLHRYSYSGSAKFQVTANAARVNPTGNYAVSSYVYKFNSPAQSVKAYCTSPWQDKAALFLRSDPFNTVYMLFASGSSGGSAQIVTNTGYNIGYAATSGYGTAGFTGTIRDQETWGPAPAPTGYSLEFTATGNVYKGYLNGSQILEWIDSGGIHPTDDTQREAAIGASQAVENFEMKDL